MLPRAAASRRRALSPRAPSRRSRSGARRSQSLILWQQFAQDVQRYTDGDNRSDAEKLLLEAELALMAKSEAAEAAALAMHDADDNYGDAQERMRKRQAKKAEMANKPVGMRGCTVGQVASAKKIIQETLTGAGGKYDTVREALRDIDNGGDGILTREEVRHAARALAAGTTTPPTPPPRRPSNPAARPNWSLAVPRPRWPAPAAAASVDEWHRPAAFRAPRKGGALYLSHPPDRCAVGMALRVSCQRVKVTLTPHASSHSVPFFSLFARVRTVLSWGLPLGFFWGGGMLGGAGQAAAQRAFLAQVRGLLYGDDARQAR